MFILSAVAYMIRAYHRYSTFCRFVRRVHSYFRVRPICRRGKIRALNVLFYTRCAARKNHVGTFATLHSERPLRLACLHSVCSLFARGAAARFIYSLCAFFVSLSLSLFILFCSFFVISYLSFFPTLPFLLTFFLFHIYIINIYIYHFICVRTRARTCSGENKAQKRAARKPPFIITQNTFKCKTHFYLFSIRLQRWESKRAVSSLRQFRRL